MLDNSKVVAVKKVFSNDFTKKQIADYAREIRFASLLRHPNVVELYGVSIILPELVRYVYDVLRKGFSNGAC